MVYDCDEEFRMVEQASIYASDSAATGDTIEELRSHSAIYQLLARFLESEIDRDLLDLLRNELKVPLLDFGIELDAQVLEGQEETVLDSLAEEYTGLLVAPGGISPYLSVFETGTMFKKACDQVSEAYQAAGLDYVSRFSGEFPDHIGTMMAFVGHLYAAQADALEQGLAQESECLRQQRESFVVDLLGHWAPGWCQRAAVAALHPLYRQVIVLAGQLLWSDLATLVDRKQLQQLQKDNRREPVKLDYDADFRKASGI